RHPPCKNRQFPGRHSVATLTGVLISVPPRERLQTEESTMRIQWPAIFLIAALAAGCTAAPRVRPVKMGPADETLEAARQFLKGRWTLVSYEVFPPGKAPVQLGGAGTGTLTYDDYGNLDMQIRVTDQKIADALGAAGVPL